MTSSTPSPTPVGAKEDGRTEFKERDALRDPALIAREVVAFLNTDGGDVWIGVREDDGLAVELQRIPDAKAELSAIQNHLIDTIEPALQDKDFEIRVTEEGLICAHVLGGRAQGPYAQLVKRGRWFGLRVGDRVREMTYEEIAKAFREQRTDQKGLIDTAIQRVQAEQEEAARRADLWLRLEPTEDLSIDFDSQGTEATFEKWLRDANSTGNRPSAWNFVVQRGYGEFKVDQWGTCTLTLGPEKSKSLEITARGSITFRVTSEKLVRHPAHEQSPTLSPYAIMEYPVSVFRLASKILARYATGKPTMKLIAGMTVRGIRGLPLFPGSPKDPFHDPEDRKVLEDDLLETPKPFTFKRDEVVNEPDRCGLRLVRWIYVDSFGFEKNDIPPEFDQARGRLILP